MRFRQRGQILQDWIYTYTLALVCKRSAFQNLLTALSSYPSVNLTPEGSGMLLQTSYDEPFYHTARPCPHSDLKVAGDVLNHVPSTPDGPLAKLLQTLDENCGSDNWKNTFPESSQYWPINITASCVNKSSANRSNLLPATKSTFITNQMHRALGSEIPVRFSRAHPSISVALWGILRRLSHCVHRSPFYEDIATIFTLFFPILFPSKLAAHRHTSGVCIWGLERYTGMQVCSETECL